MSKNRNELLADFGDFDLLAQVLLCFEQLNAGIEMVGNHLREQAKHRQRLLVVDLSGLGIDGAKCPEHTAVLAHDRNGDIALEPVLSWRVVPEIGALGDVIDRHGFICCANFVAYRRLDNEFTTLFQAEIDAVENLAGDPAALRYPCDRHESHSGRLADDFEDRRNCRYVGDRIDIGLELMPACFVHGTLVASNRDGPFSVEATFA